MGGGRGNGKGARPGGQPTAAGPMLVAKRGKNAKRIATQINGKTPPDAAGEASCYYNNPQASTAGAAMR